MPVWEEQAYTRKDEDGNLQTLVRISEPQMQIV